MKKSKFSEAQVAAALRGCASGTPIGQVARRLGVSEQTLYTWKKKYAALGAAPRHRGGRLDAVRLGVVGNPKRAG